MKTCSKCLQTKPLEAFHKRNTKGTCGVQSHCKACVGVHMKAYSESKGRYLAFGRKYGISKKQYFDMREAQQNKCAICSKVLNDKGTRAHDGAAIDHCHTTGKIRGLLCNHCNRGLGMFQDDPDTLIKASLYLTSTRHDTDASST